MTFCSSCGKEMNIGAKFCESCGSQMADKNVGIENTVNVTIDPDTLKRIAKYVVIGLTIFILLLEIDTIASNLNWSD